jgi:hypothetical protein
MTQREASLVSYLNKTLHSFGVGHSPHNFLGFFMLLVLRVHLTLAENTLLGLDPLRHLHVLQVYPLILSHS